MNLVDGILRKLGVNIAINVGPVSFNHVDLFYWRPVDGGLNFGDHLSFVIVTKMLADRGFLLEEETIDNKRLLALGSILHFAETSDVIWGTGMNGKVPLSDHKFENLDVRAVRGPLTRSFLTERGITVPEIYGDPALLLPYIFPGRFIRETKKNYVIVPNLHDLRIVQDQKWENVVSPLNSWNKCITEIMEAEFVIASSLHGLIIAEAFGIPARYIRLSETENLFKYNDYTMGTGRSEIEFATSIPEALEMKGMSDIIFNYKALLDAFPIDLWQGNHHEN